MIAEVCRFYGWTPNYVLSMPAFMFFAFATQSRRVAARERLQETKLHMLPAMQLPYLHELQAEYLGIINDRPRVVEEPPAAMAWTDPNAQSFIRNAFTEHRRSKYGR